MTPEEQLDGLIGRWEPGASLGRVESLKVKACLAAAAALMQLQALAVPPAFAARLEARVRAHARNLAAPQRKVIAFPRASAAKRETAAEGRQALTPRTGDAPPT